ncbi:MAG TPA: hypothetical protein VL691_18650 [Vicinamibacteria bacterium]|nr:hypothetical protein [Vicinamibacteria bacterium]
MASRTMSLYHVAVTGRDRRHLTALGAKLRVVVVGYREGKRGIVVDAYVPSEKLEWLERQGYGVTRLEEVDRPDRQRQAQGREAVASRLRQPEEPTSARRPPRSRSARSSWSSS